jgi:hypothetical protein
MEDEDVEKYIENLEKKSKWNFIILLYYLKIKNKNS